MVLPSVAFNMAGWSAQKAVAKVGDKYDSFNGKYGERFEKYGIRLPSRQEGRDPSGLGENGEAAGYGAGPDGGAPGGPGSEMTPYMNKWDHISQVWFNRWTVLLLLVLARVLMAMAGLRQDIDDAEQKVISACVQLEQVGSNLASMPHYMSTGVNTMTGNTIQSTVRGLVSGGVMLISAVQQIVLFIIDTWRSTWMCLISALVQGAFDAAEVVVEGVIDLAKAAVADVAQLLTDAENTFNGFINDINRIPLVPDAPQINFNGAIDSLKNLNIDGSSAVKFISDIKAKVPTYAELKQIADDLISTPFNMAKTAIDGKWGNFTFDHGVLPVAAQKEVALCSNDPRIPEFFADLTGVLMVMRTVFIVIIVLLSLAAMAWFVFVELHRWKKAERTIELANEKAHDLMDAAWISNHPYLARFAFWAAAKISDDPDKQLLVRWTVAYGTSAPALFVLALGVSGLFGALMQVIVLQQVKARTPGLAASVGGLAADVVGSLDQSSVAWARDTNGVIGKFQNDLNEEMFGHVKTMAGSIDSVIQKFEDVINQGLNDTFGGSPFLDAIRGVVDCVLLDKLEKVQQGLEWVQNNSAVAFPTVSNDTFSLTRLTGNGPEAQAFLSNPGTTASTEIATTMAKITDGLVMGLVAETVIGFVLVLVYVLVVLMGLGRAVWANQIGVTASPPVGGLGGASSYDADPDQLGGGDDAGHHWVEHEGREYMVGPDGEYVVGPDGEVVSREVGSADHGAAGGDNPFRDHYAADKSDYYEYPRDEKRGLHEEAEAGSPSGGDGSFADRHYSGGRALGSPPQYPAPSYASPYVEDENKF